MDKAIKVRTNRLWLTSRNIKGLEEVSVRVKLPPRLSHDDARLRPLSSSARDAIRSAWQQFVTSGAKTTAGISQLLGVIELVGAHVTVVKATNPCHLLKRGVLIDESEKMMYIQEDESHRVLQIQKKGSHFQVPVGDQTFVIIGDGIDRPVVTRTKAKKKKVYDFL
eukprot:Blabericola_migrator_1__4619@NODE_244_length_10915_cov_46_014012_g206_i0_p4_GENE_NODE_244_length_10915_cov_46_014012_g206_i0NODE_244_length_10915_cov_46_014012_g206_i0_p4_ORF_typecomplete_len166_score27_10UPF0086/PF01868_16/4_4e11_NODE_244_length_10915_cov_46_014012_g206_i079308427